jgi:hypothetical protein
MTTLEHKRQQLSLVAMSHQLEQTIAEAVARNMSVAATLEWLADLELEARHVRATARHFKMLASAIPTHYRCFPLPAP